MLEIGFFKIPPATPGTSASMYKGYIFLNSRLSLQGLHGGEHFHKQVFLPSCV